MALLLLQAWVQSNLPFLMICFIYDLVTVEYLTTILCDVWSIIARGQTSYEFENIL
jgi:hypothetical protein